MKNKLTYILFFLTFLLISCETDKKKDSKKNVQTDSLRQDTLQIREAFNQEDSPVNDYLADRLKPIRENFKKINSITNWISIHTEELSESTEGGEAKYYYLNEKLEKIVARHYGESFQLLTEYYLLNGQLSFVFEKKYKYNRPLYYDKAVMEENNDSEMFDFDKSEIIENRSYFENGKLLHQLSNEDTGTPFADDYLLSESKRIKADLENLIEKTKNKQQPSR